MPFRISTGLRPWLRPGLSAEQTSAPRLPMPIIVGAPRSGTTLLRFMLDAHPELAIPPETGFLALGSKLTGRGESLRKKFFDAITNYPPDAPGWQDFQIAKEIFWAKLVELEPFTVADGYRAFYQLYAARFAKPRWGDKTPMYCMHMEKIAATLPEAHFIHLIRDGRDVALSLRQTWFSPGQEIETQAAYWRRCVTTAQRQGERCRNYLEVRYEDLILKTQETLEQICEFLNLTYDDCMLRYYERTPERLQEHEARFKLDGSVLIDKAQRLNQQQLTTEPPDRARIFAWKSVMSADERARFEKVAGSVLRKLSYEV